MQEIVDAIESGASGTEIGNLALPESYRAVVIRREDAAMFEGMAGQEKDPRKSLHVQEVPLPELAPDEAYVAVMASSINFNTVWTSIFEPLPTFGFLDRLGQREHVGQASCSRLPHHWVRRLGRGAARRFGRTELEAR